METTEKVSSHRVEKRVKRTNRSEAPPCAREKPRADWKMDLQTCGVGRKSRKGSTPVLDKKPNGKCQLVWAERKGQDSNLRRSCPLKRSQAA